MSVDKSVGVPANQKKMLDGGALRHTSIAEDSCSHTPFQQGRFGRSSLDQLRGRNQRCRY